MFNNDLTTTMSDSKSKQTNILSIDLEDWYQGLTSTSQKPEEWERFEQRVSAATNKVLRILAERNIKATFFVLGKVAGEHPHLVKKIHSQGHEIAIHGYNHQLLSNLTPAEFAKDIDRTLKLIKGITGVEALGYRAPCFSVSQKTSWALKILKDKGLKYDSSIFPASNILYGLPGTKREPHYVKDLQDFMEFPPSVIRIGGVNVPFGGGFYVRALPLRFVKWALRKVNSRGVPAVMYFHPWEFDPEHPKPSQTTLRERISHYYNLKEAEKKFRTLLDTFRFQPIKEFLNQDYGNLSV